MKTDYKKKYDKLKKEFLEYRFQTEYSTKEDKIKCLREVLKIKDGDSPSFLWKLSHEDIDLLIKFFRGKEKGGKSKW